MELSFCEKVVFSLRELFGSRGYSQYKMSKFEQYDLYANNKDFLISDRVITFMDTNGKLMALKPDVTLSIVKNTLDAEGFQKLYYNENVYRAARNDHCFKEIMQVGLECLGNIDDYCICEVLELAAQSLCSISESCVLDVSHLGLVSALIDDLGVPAASKDALLGFIGQKNTHELMALCQSCGVQVQKAEVLKQLVLLRGTPDRVIPKAKALLAGMTDLAPLAQLEAVASACGRQCVQIDFSVVDDIHYYNGIVFKGFVQGLPESILSGGQYDKLMKKMGRTSGAIGFAVYMDLLERLESGPAQYDVDTLLLYGADTPLTEITRQAKLLNDRGITVSVQRSIPENLRYRQIITL